MLSRQAIRIGKRSFSFISPLCNEAEKQNGPVYLGQSIDNLEGAKETGSSRIAIQFQKNFPIGTTYDPFDFSLAKLNLEKKAFRQGSVQSNGFDRKNLNPLDYYTTPRYLSAYLSSTGKILHRDVTGLSEKNQKRLTVAVHRAINAGLLSSVHKDVALLPHRHGI